MSWTKVLVTLALASVVLLRTSRCHAAPLTQHLGSAGPMQSSGILQEQYDEEQLESLKSLEGKSNVEITHSQSNKISKTDGKTEMHQSTERKVKDVVSGETLARISKERVVSQEPNQSKPHSVTKTELDVPSKGIHKVTVEKKAKSKDNTENFEMTEDYLSPFDGAQFTPFVEDVRGIADYVRRTGDQDGVAMAVEELVNEGLMSKPEADAYIDEVRNEMEFQQMQQQHLSPVNSYRAPQIPSQSQRVLSVNEEHIVRHPVPNPFQMPSSASRQHLTFNAGSGQTHSKGLSDALATNNYPSAIRSKITQSNTHKMNYLPKPNVFQDEEQDENEMLIRPAGNREMEDENDYNDLIERIRIADFLYKEYSLEEIIYQLAKDMFVQSSLKGAKEAEQSLQRFSNFLQEEAAEGRISKDLGIRILDVVMAALVDAAGQQSPKSNNEGFNQNYGRNMMSEKNNRRPEIPQEVKHSLPSSRTSLNTNLNKESATLVKSSKVDGKVETGSGGTGKSIIKTNSKEN